MSKIIYLLIGLYLIISLVPVVFKSVPLFQTRIWFYLGIVVILIAAALSFYRVWKRK